MCLVGRGYQCVPYPPQQAAEEGNTDGLPEEETGAQGDQDLLPGYQSATQELSTSVSHHNF